MKRTVLITLLFCCLGRLATADVIITADEARVTIAKLDTLDYLRDGAETDSSKIANLLAQVKVQEARNMEMDQILTKALFNTDEANKKNDRLGRQKNAWRMLAYITTAVAAVTTGILIFSIK